MHEATEELAASDHACFLRWRDSTTEVDDALRPFDSTHRPNIHVDLLRVKLSVDQSRLAKYCDSKV